MIRSVVVLIAASVLVLCLLGWRMLLGPLLEYRSAREPPSTTIVPGDPGSVVHDVDSSSKSEWIVLNSTPPSERIAVLGRDGRIRAQTVCTPGSLSVSSDGTRVLVAHDFALQCRSLPSLDLLWERDITTSLEGVAEIVAGCETRPDDWFVLCGDGEVIRVSSGGDVVRIRASGGARVSGGCGWSRDEAIVLRGDHEIAVVDLASGADIRSFSLEFGSWLSRVASAGGVGWFVSGGEEPVLGCFNPDTGDLLSQRSMGVDSSVVLGRMERGSQVLALTTWVGASELKSCVAEVFSYDVAIGIKADHRIDFRRRWGTGACGHLRDGSLAVIGGDESETLVWRLTN